MRSLCRSGEEMTGRGCFCPFLPALPARLSLPGYCPLVDTLSLPCTVCTCVLRVVDADLHMVQWTMFARVFSPDVLPL